MSPLFLFWLRRGWFFGRCLKGKVIVYPFAISSCCCFVQNAAAAAAASEKLGYLFCCASSSTFLGES